MMPTKSIFLRYLEGKASPEEAAMIEAWQAASPSNKESFDQLWKLWQPASNKPYKAPVVSDAWKDLLDRIQAPTTGQHIQARTLPVRKYFFMATGAAFIALMVFIGWPKDRQEAAVVQKQSTGECVRDTLANGLVAVLDTYSSLRYPAGSRGGLELGVNGAVFFEPQPIGNTPVTVKAGELLLRPAAGTGFYVRNDSLNGMVAAAVDAGVVVLSDGSNQVALEPGEAVEYNSKLHVFGSKHAANINSFSYATRVFYFNDTPLAEAVGYLSKAYHIPISINNPAAAACRITTQFDNKSIEYIMDIMSATLHFNYEFVPQRNSINISGEGCN